MFMRDFLSNCATSTVQGLKSLKKKSLIKNQDTISIKNTDLRHSELRIFAITVQSFRTGFGISNLANRSFDSSVLFETLKQVQGDNLYTNLLWKPLSVAMVLPIDLIFPSIHPLHWVGFSFMQIFPG